MGIPVMILGESGTGKTASLRNFNEKEVLLIQIAKKPLPFKNKFINFLQSSNYREIAGKIRDDVKENDTKIIVIDDSQYLMAFEFFEKINERGYEKFTQMAVNFKNLIDYTINKLPDDIIIYFMHHTEKGEFGTKAKTIGKMIDEKLTLEGLFSIVFGTEVSADEYLFTTKNNGNNTVKTPMGMFENSKIPNDLKNIDSIIREYYQI